VLASDTCRQEGEASRLATQLVSMLLIDAMYELQLDSQAGTMEGKLQAGVVSLSREEDAGEIADSTTRVTVDRASVAVVVCTSSVRGSVSVKGPSVPVFVTVVPPLTRVTVYVSFGTV